jgi:hypothetical protein
MSIISRICKSPPPKKDGYLTRREFLSSNGKWRAVFSDPNEWHMCAPGWELKIESTESNLPVPLPDYEILSNSKGLLFPIDYSPWSHDSKTIALNFWESGLVFFAPATKSSKVLPYSSFVVNWSPTENQLLIFFKDWFLVLDDQGFVKSKIPWKTAVSELPRVGWLPSGKTFFIIGRSSRRAKPRITLIDAETGIKIAGEILDPNKILPYEDSKYRAIPRSGYSLVLSPGSQTVGTLLDTWNEVIFEKDNGFFLSVYRPISEVFSKDGYPACKVEEKWVSMQLDKTAFMK